MDLLSPPAFAASDLKTFVSPYKRLFRDKRLFEGFQACIWGIIGSGSCRVSQMAAHNPITAHVPHGERRLRRLLHARNQRAEVDADALGKVLSEEGAKLLAGEQEVLLVIDESDLRKPYSRRLEYLDTVSDLSGKSVPGYVTLSVLGIGESGQRALLYQRTFSSNDPEFKSLNKERERAIVQVEQALRKVLAGRFIWVMDRGFDDRKVFAFLQQRGSCFVVRVQHLERQCHAHPQDPKRALNKLLEQASYAGDVFLESRLVNEQASEKTLSLKTYVAKLELHQPRGLELSVVQLRHPDLKQPWTLASNLKDDDKARLAKRLVQLYRMRWSIEDIYAWTKGALDWESAALLSYPALRTLVSFAWLAAAFVFDLAGKLELPQLLFLARLGGWTPSKRPPGKALLTQGLARLLAYLQVDQLLQRDRHAAFSFQQLSEAFFPS